MASGSHDPPPPPHISTPPESGGFPFLKSRRNKKPAEAGSSLTPVGGVLRLFVCVE